MSKAYSIRRQLLAMSTILIILIGLGAYWVAKLYADRAARISYDHLMLGAALQMMETINMLDGQIVIDLPVAAFETLALAADDRVFYSISGQKNLHLTGYYDLPTPPNNSSIKHLSKIQLHQPIFYTAQYSNETVRFVSLSHTLIEDDLSERVQLIVGQTTLARKALSEEISWLVLRFILLFIAISLCLIMFGIWLILRPLRTLKHEFETRSSTDLTPITTTLPTEVMPLLTTINFFMLQLNTTLIRLKKFTAEATHQIRTPLAGLISQAQNAVDETDPTLRAIQLERVLECSQVLDNTVNQLLNQAILTHRFQSDEAQSLSFNELIKQVCREMAIVALKKKVEIAYLSDITIRIKGNDFILRQMLQNILDNAIKYSPSYSVIEVDLFIKRQQKTSAIVLQIKDQGKGIPDKEKELVFGYFYRAANNLSPGSGIGLAIALEIAEHHNATFHLKDNLPSGLIVEVVFPAKDDLIT